VSNPGLPTAPPCPNCGSVNVAVDLRAVSNWLRLPLGLILMTVSRADVVDIWQRCNACGERFPGTFLNDDEGTD